MNKELINEKSWWQKNYKWFAPLVICIIVIGTAFLFSDADTGVGNYAKAYADTALYENALIKAQQNPEVIQVLGNLNPPDKMAIAEGAVEYTDNDKAVTSTIAIKGSKGKAKLDIAAHKSDNTWQYSLIKIRPKNNTEIIVLQDSLSKLTKTE